MQSGKKNLCKINLPETIMQDDEERERNAETNEVC